MDMMLLVHHVLKFQMLQLFNHLQLLDVVMDITYLQLLEDVFYVQLQLQVQKMELPLVNHLQLKLML